MMLGSKGHVFFESMLHGGLRYLPLPEEYAFDYRMTAFYRPGNLFSSRETAFPYS